MILVPLKFELKSDDAHYYLVNKGLLQANCDDAYGIEVTATIAIDLDDGYMEIDSIDDAKAWLPNGKEVDLDADDFESYIETEMERQSSQLLTEAHATAQDHAEALYDARYDR